LDGPVPCAGAYGERGGIDWHNLCAAFPTGVLPIDHPWIGTSLERWRHAYVEGVFPYPYDANYHWVHNYNTINLSETWLRRREHAEALRDLYGLLLHTTATHGSAEVVDTVGRRDFSCTPHNWFSAKLVRFIRDLLVYEGDDGALHLLGGLAPAWMRPGEDVSLSDAPTEYGMLSFRAHMRKGGMDLDIDFAPRGDPAALVLHLPPFLESPYVSADGAVVPGENGTYGLPVAARRVVAEWANDRLPDVSFDRVAEGFIRDYRRRVAEFRENRSSSDR
jgi:hypothetical protein